jgi:hypothetical protein
MLSERSERRDAREPQGALGPAALRAAIRGIDPERVAIGPSRNAIVMAALYVLADAGDEIVLAAPIDPSVSEAATISGLDAQPLTALDAETVFDAAGERTRAFVLDASTVTSELLALLGEVALPVIVVGAIAPDPILSTPDAPLVLVVAEEHDHAWVAALGPADRAEPFLARLALHASVFLRRAGDPTP